MRATLLAAALCLPLQPALAQDSTRIQFEAGNDTAAVSGTVTGHDYVDYVLGARAGQTMSVALSVDETDGHGIVYFNIMPPGTDWQVIYNGSTYGREGQADLPESGDYTVRIYQMGDDRDSGKTAAYTLSVTIM